MTTRASIVELLAGLRVAGDDARDPPAPPREADDRRMIQRGPAQVGKRPRQGDRQPGVVELPVGVDDPAAEAAIDDRREPPDDLGRPDPARSAQVGSTGQQVVDLQPDPIVRQVPPSIRRHDEVAAMDQMRGIAEEEPALVERLADQGMSPWAR